MNDLSCVSRIQNAVGRLQAAARAVDAVSVQGQSSGRINEMLYSTERLLTRQEGLEGRSWFKHFIYAPGFYTGYGVKTIPGVRESIEQRDYEQADAQIVIAAGVLNGLSDRLDLLLSELQKNSG